MIRVKKHIDDGKKLFFKWNEEHWNFEGTLRWCRRSYGLIKQAIKAEISRSTLDWKNEIEGSKFSIKIGIIFLTKTPNFSWAWKQLEEWGLSSESVLLVIFDQKVRNLKIETNKQTNRVRIVSRGEQDFRFVSLSEIFSELVVGDVPHDFFVDFIFDFRRRRCWRRSRLNRRLVGLSHRFDRLRDQFRRSFVAQGFGDLLSLILPLPFFLENKTCLYLKRNQLKVEQQKHFQKI